MTIETFLNPVCILHSFHFHTFLNSIQMQRHTREFLVMEAHGLMALGIPRDLSADLVPCLARGKFTELGKPITLHLTQLFDGCEESSNVASVVYSPKGSFVRMVLQRNHASRCFE